MKYGDIFNYDKYGVDLLSASTRFNPTASMKTVKISQEYAGKPWIIAEALYNDHRLWWAIAKVNNIRLPFICRDSFRINEDNSYSNNIITDFYYGRVIYIPTISDINAYVNKVKEV